MNVCAEIQYDDVHSDICLGHNMSEFAVDPEYRALLHDCLDEWLNKSDGTGGFWIGDPAFMAENFKEE
jgi:hypothetical protein